MEATEINLKDQKSALLTIVDEYIDVLQRASIGVDEKESGSGALGSNTTNASLECLKKFEEYLRESPVNDLSRFSGLLVAVSVMKDMLMSVIAKNNKPNMVLFLNELNEKLEKARQSISKNAKRKN